jgi:hypothetical protein
MKSEKITLDHMICGSMFSSRQIQISQFSDFKTALDACNAANSRVGSFYYLINELGKEYYENAWID